MKSDVMKNHLDKEEFIKNFKSIDGEELEDIEYNIAEKIISDYSVVQGM